MNFPGMGERWQFPSSGSVSVSDVILFLKPSYLMYLNSEIKYSSCEAEKLEAVLAGLRQEKQIANKLNVSRTK